MILRRNLDSRTTGEILLKRMFRLHLMITDRKSRYRDSQSPVLVKQLVKTHELICVLGSYPFVH